VLDAQIIQRTLRVPAPTGGAADGAVVARQLDAVLLRVGFGATRELLDHMSRLRRDAAVDAAVAILAAVRELVGDHRLAELVLA
jgi:enhancing lycopene biosynthesis protein 2